MLHDAELDGRRLTVREDREDREVRGGGGGGGGGRHEASPNPRQQPPGGGGGGGPQQGGKRNRDERGAASSSGGRRCFVSNLSWNTSWQDLKDYFRQAGKVVYASVMQEEDTGRSKGCGIVEFETPEEAAKAIDMLHDTELDGRPVSVREDREDREVKTRGGGGRAGDSATWGGTNIANNAGGNAAGGNTRRRSSGEQNPPGGTGTGTGGSSSEVVRVGRRVYVGNLAWSTSWQDLKDFFRQAGNVVYANVMTEDDTGRSKGCGIVEFESSEEAVYAIETLHDAELDGRRLTVREDREDKDLKGLGAGPYRDDRRQRAKRSRVPKGGPQN